MIKIGEINEHGFFNVEFMRSSGEAFVTLYGCSVKKNRNGEEFVSMPARSYEKDGEKKWTNQARVDDKVQNDILDAYHAAQHTQVDDSDVPF
jgi:hypothetical protein